MFKILSWTLLVATLVAGCSSKQPSVKADATSIAAHSRSSAPMGEDTDLLLARKWQSEDNMLLIDLNLDGTFIGELDSRPIEGTWSISDDRTQLNISESKGVEGKGKTLQQVYTIVSNSAESMILQDETGKQWTLLALD